MSEVDSEVRTGEAAQDGPERAGSSGLILAAAALLWMAAMLRSAWATITGQDDVAMEVTSTAYAMPGAVSASLVAGAAVALAVRAFLTRGGRDPGATVRSILTTGAGLGIGLLGALPIFMINVEGWIYAVVAGTIAAAATIGGALASFRHTRVVAAAGAGAIAAFLVGVLLAFVQDDLLPALGAGNTAASQASAAGNFSLVQGVLGGLAAGLVAYRVLRRARRRSGTELKWPLYTLAGAGPGLLLVIAEILTRTAGARVLELAGKVSELELTVQRMLSGSRLNVGLIVLFVGAFTAMVAVGRSMGTPNSADPAGAAAPDSDAAAEPLDPASTSPKPASIGTDAAPVGMDPDEIERRARAD
ncbi:hypothetical protein [Actinoplanes sp. NPDC051859]|uniref:hypothetical protein n=1 Tax=Actinoplanes sp. NPDC051859 TaxID=3363909 RepID=UPI0037AAE4B1